MHIRNLILYVTTLLSSCAFGPVNNVGFDDINDISMLEGKYKNRGEHREGYSGPPVYLSGIIWLDSDENNPIAYEIDTIEVRKIDASTLIVRGLEGGIIRRESTFIYGKDFIIESGRIHLGYESEFLGDEKGGNPLIGFGITSRSLGIDKRSDGKYREYGAVAGALFLAIPIVALGSDDVRFVKIDE